jgi:hypothetical protein
MVPLHCSIPMLPNPSNKYIQQINDTLYAFIWNGTSKINKIVLVKDYMEGGLRMVNINVFMNALKLTWIRIISSDGCWISILTQGIDVQKLVTYGKHYVEKM